MIFADSHAARAQALAEIEAHERFDFDANCTRLQGELTERRARRDAAIIEAHELAAAKALELEIAIAAEAVAAFWPLAVEFADSPRTTSKAFSDRWNALNARCREELGAELSYKLCGLAFAAAHGVAEAVAGPFFYTFDGSNVAAQKTHDAVAIITKGDAPIVVQAALEALELAIASKARGYTKHPARLEAMTSRATEAAQRIACDLTAKAPESDASASAEIAAAQAAHDDRMMIDMIAARAEARDEPRVDLHPFGEP